MLDILKLEWLGFALVLTALLTISFGSRARVFCQYLRLMTGIAVTPREVKKIFKLRGKAGVRELFLDLLIREDLAETPVITPETPRLKPAAELIGK